MPSFSRRANRLLQLVVIAALTVTIRLPFLLHADRFFDSDEAVEGLMARHVLEGELPVFLWGQQYKGVPEVYFAAAVFAAAGSSVAALKATTLACFVLFMCLQFLAVERMFSSRVAWMTTAFLLVGPPALVLWTLSGNAEVVLTLLAGTVLVLAWQSWEQSRSRLAIAVGAASVGFGLWVHQYIVFYVIALALCLLSTSPAARGWLRRLVAGEHLPPWVRLLTSAVLAIAGLYVILGLMAFVTGGFDVPLGGALIGLRNPQKLWRIAAALVVIFTAVRVFVQLLHPTRRASRSLALATLFGFLIGYAPALAATIRSGSQMPLARMDARGLVSASATIVDSIIPIVLGVRSPTTEWLLSPWALLIPAAVMVWSFAGLRSRTATPFFHIFLIVVPVVFVASGSFIDAQSYRYVMPVHAALPVVLAVGIDRMSQWSRPAGLAALAALLVVFATLQTAWYTRLTPDTTSSAIIECLTRQGVRGTRADYWLSYKVTFLSGETVIVAPDNGVDRYPPYTRFVQSLGDTAAGQPCRPLLLQ